MIKSYNPADPVQRALMEHGTAAAVAAMKAEAPAESEYASCVARAEHHIAHGMPLGITITRGQVRFTWAD